MKINEIASAEDQLSLWKLVSDSVWQSISKQAEEERQAKALKAQQSKSKSPKRGKRGGTAPKPIPAKISTSPPKPLLPTDKPNQRLPLTKPAITPVAPVKTGPFGATGVPPVPPTPPAAPAVSTAPAMTKAMPRMQTVAKPKITARAGGLTT